MPPLVDLAVLRHPAQSLSVKVVKNSGMVCHLNLLTSLGLPLRYRPSLLINFMCDCLGADIALAASFTENPMSGRSGAR